MAESTYWSRRTLSRRATLRGAGLGLAGFAGAALFGCGGADEESQEIVGGGGAAITATAGKVDANATPVPKDQVRLKPGLYSAPVAASPAEQNPMVNGKYGGTLRMQYLDPPHMDINRTLSCTIYHTMDYTNSKLIRGKTGANAHPFLVEIEPDLAESWEGTPDNRTFTFHLRKGIKTHNVAPTNGREYTSEDVKLSMERYKKGGTQQDVFAPVTSIETPDKYTVKVTLDQPISDFPVNVSSWSFMWVKELIDNDTMLKEKAIGTGAFIQKEWTNKERSVFVKNPDYFEKGLPFLDEVVTLVQNDAAVLRAGFITDNFMDWSAPDEDAWQSASKQRSDTYVGWKLPISRGANVNGWHLQMKNPKFQDPRVRHAISLAFDRDAYDQARNAGDNASPEGAFSNPPMPWALLYEQKPTAKANGPWYRFNPGEASKLLQAAGYTADKPLEFEHVTWYDREPSAQVIIPGIHNSVKEIKIKFRQVDNPTHVVLLSDRNFEDAAGIVWGPPGHAMDQWIFPWYHTKGGLNYNNKGDAALDRLLEQQRAASQLDEKKAVWQKVWDKIHDEVWDLWWPEAYGRRAWHNYVMNYRGHGLMGTYVCYVSGQARAIWLDDGAPGVKRS